MLDIVQTPAQKAVLDRLTALMTLLEGHAEFVMDGVGPEVIPSVEPIRAKFNRRREGGNPLEKAIRRLLGIEVKMRQYAEGRKFVHGVVERVGMAGFNKIFELAADPAPARRAGRPGRLGGPGARAAARRSPRLIPPVARIPAPVAAVRVAVRRGAARPTGWCWWPAPVGPTRWRWPPRPASSAPAGSALVTVDHGLQEGSAGGPRGRRLGPRRPGSTRSMVATVEVGRAAGRAGGGGPGRPGTRRCARPPHRCGAAAVLLGHTRDDQAETVLLALARGAGPRGLAGMPRAAGGSAAAAAAGRRPRTDTREACAALGLVPWEDPHNIDPAYARSRVRADGAAGAGGGARARPWWATWPGRRR